jgi:hypothetical protein
MLFFYDKIRHFPTNLRQIVFIALPPKSMVYWQQKKGAAL